AGGDARDQAGAGSPRHPQSRCGAEIRRALFLGGGKRARYSDWRVWVRKQPSVWTPLFSPGMVTKPLTRCIDSTYARIYPSRHHAARSDGIPCRLRGVCRDRTGCAPPDDVWNIPCSARTGQREDRGDGGVVAVPEAGERLIEGDVDLAL